MEQNLPEVPNLSLEVTEKKPSARKLPHDILVLLFNQVACIPRPLDYLSHLEGDEWGNLQQSVSNEARRSSGLLALMSLVSKDWNGTAVPLLYKFMRLKTKDQIVVAGATLELRHDNPYPWIGASHGTFVRRIDVGTRREMGYPVDTADVIVDVQRLVAHSPYLRSFRTSTWSSGSRNAVGLNAKYGTRLIPSLLNCGQHLTMLEISDSIFQVPDLQRLINGLPSLETLIATSLLMLELQSKRVKIRSETLKTIVFFDLQNKQDPFTCQLDLPFSVIASWTLPKLESVLVQDCCPINRVLRIMQPVLTRNQGTLRNVVFRRWAFTFTTEEVKLLRETFIEFSNMKTTSSSVCFFR